jgi:hypothetical protein
MATTQKYIVYFSRENFVSSELQKKNTILKKTRWFFA